MTEAFYCEICGESHAGRVLDVAFLRPDPYLEVPEDERAARCRCDNDLCHVDGMRFFVRGILALPLTDMRDHAALGVWAEVAKEHFDRYVELYDDPGQVDQPAFPGVLATHVPGYPPTLGLSLSVRLSPPPDRPTLLIADPTHPLERQQREGVSLQGWLAIHHRLHDRAR